MGGDGQGWAGPPHHTPTSLLPPYLDLGQNDLALLRLRRIARKFLGFFFSYFFWVFLGGWRGQGFFPQLFFLVIFGDQLHQ